MLGAVNYILIIGVPGSENPREPPKNPKKRLKITILAILGTCPASRGHIRAMLQKGTPAKRHPAKRHPVKRHPAKRHPPKRHPPKRHPFNRKAPSPNLLLTNLKFSQWVPECGDPHLTEC